MSTTSQPPRPSFPHPARTPLGNRPLPKGIVALGQAQPKQIPGALAQGARAPLARDSVPDGTLIVGRDIHVKGQIDDCRELIVEGRVEATLKAARLEVRAGGSFLGTAEVKLAAIAGAFEGKLQAGELLSVAAGGRVRGEIRYARIAIEAGGEIGGDVDIANAGEGEGEGESESRQPSLAVSGS